jgi:hypothetical protein
MTKYEWRKAEKVRYFPKQPELTTIPASKYIYLEGAGDPNKPNFSADISALYPVAYALRMAFKRGEITGEPFEYTVYPLAGLWTTSDGSRGDKLNKDALVYRIMLRQPAAVTPELFAKYQQQALAKKKNPRIGDVQFAEVPAQTVAQAVHVGPFATEGETFAKLETLIKDADLQRGQFGGYQHQEIYISDFRKTAPDKLKTLLRLKTK